MLSQRTTIQFLILVGLCTASEKFYRSLVETLEQVTPEGLDYVITANMYCNSADHCAYVTQITKKDAAELSVDGIYFSFGVSDTELARVKSEGFRDSLRKCMDKFSERACCFIYFNADSNHYDVQSFNTAE